MLPRSVIGILLIVNDLVKLDSSAKNTSPLKHIPTEIIKSISNFLADPVRMGMCFLVLIFIVRVFKAIGMERNRNVRNEDFAGKG